MSKIAIIRIKGKFSLSPNVRRALASLRLNRLHTCALLNQSDSLKGMVQQCKDVTIFGEPDEEAATLLLQKRGLSLDGKKLSDSKKPEEIAKIAKDFMASEKKLEEFGALGIFFLSPPRGGFTGGKKFSAPYGSVGKNAKISDLLKRMA